MTEGCEIGKTRNTISQENDLNHHPSLIECGLDYAVFLDLTISPSDIKKKKDALYLSVNVFSTKVLIGDTVFTSPTGEGIVILRGHPNHVKV